MLAKVSLRALGSIELLELSKRLRSHSYVEKRPEWLNEKTRALLGGPWRSMPPSLEKSGSVVFWANGETQTSTQSLLLNCWVLTSILIAVVPEDQSAMWSGVRAISP